MTSLYLDTFSGISGDMLLGALLDLGLDFEAFKAQLAKLKVTGFELTAKRVAHSSIYGTDFDVVLDHGTKDQGFIETKHHHDHPEDQHHHHHHGEVRHLKDIETIINASELSTRVKTQASQVFADIAQAEAVVHAMPVDEVHFHEVGALDSIVDIVGIFVALEMLGIDEVRASELVDGTGFIEVAHGKMPVPVPAVMQMRVGTTIPVRQLTDVPTELITPTGMGVVKALVQDFGPVPTDWTIQKIGYGFGKRQTKQLNALRVLLCEKKNSNH
jgi:uncharacterized protein (TIGR00299 family) protein